MLERLFLSLTGSLVLIISSCNKPSQFAEFLVEGDEVEVFFTTLDLQGKTIAGDSVRTYDDTLSTQMHFVGSMDDAYFGRSQASLFFQVRITAEADFNPKAKLDSVVLTLAYDTLLQGYGDLMAEQTFEVYRLTSDLVQSTNYYSNTQHEVDPKVLGELQGFIPDFKSTVQVAEPDANGMIDTNTYVPHIRIRLDSLFGRELLSFTEDDFVNNEAFLQKLKGFEVRPKPGSGGMIFLDMFGGLSRLNLYYHQGDTARQFVYFVNNASVITNTYTIDNINSPVGQVIGSLEHGDSLLYIQSMGGPRIEFTLPDLSELAETTINHAEIDLTLAQLAEDDTLQYPPFDAILARVKLDDGSLILVPDALNFINANTYGNVYGLMEDDGRMHFRINVTEYVSALLEGDLNNKLVITNLTAASEPTRAIFYGTQHSRYKAQLKITHTAFSSN